MTRRLQSLKDNFNKALTNDFNWTKCIHLTFSDLIPQIAGYIKTQGHHVNYIPLEKARSMLLELFQVFGIKISPIERYDSLLRGVTDFRTKIRSIAISQLLEGNQGLANETLKACDDVRNVIRSHGHEINVRLNSMALMISIGQIIY